MNNNNEAVTTSLAIAEGAQVQHKNVLELIRKNINDFNEFNPIAFKTRKGEPLPQGGFAKSTEYAELNEQQVTLLFTYMRNSEIVKKFKIRLVKTFFEMREQLSKSFDPSKLSRIEILQIAMNAEEERARLEKENKELAPKAQGFDRVALSEGSMNLTRAAKVLDVQPRVLIDFMSQNKWIYRKAGNGRWLAYQDKIQSGYLTHKIYQRILDDGTERCDEQVLIKPKGLTRLSTILNGREPSASAILL